MAFEDWRPDWRADTAVIVASGPSAADAGVGAVDGRARVLAINEGWRLAPFAEALYACDGAWWTHHKGLPGYEGLKITSHAGAAQEYGLRRVKLDSPKSTAITVDEPGVIGSGFNSGFQALNLAIQFGAKRVVLVGYDMRVDEGVHWHGPHERGLNNPCRTNIARWARALDAQAPLLKRLGIEVLNASPVSALEAYPKVRLEDALR